MFITLIRHAQIQTNSQGRYIGHSNITLSNFGLKDAGQLADYLKKYHQHKDFDAIYCSDLTRCRQTLKAISDKLNLTIAPFFTKALREKSWGKHEGLNYDEICQLENTTYQNFDQWINILDGETKEQFIQRINQFNKKLLQSGHQNILIVTHSGVIRTLIYLSSHLTFEQSFYMQIPYASFVVINEI